MIFLQVSSILPLVKGAMYLSGQDGSNYYLINGNLRCTLFETGRLEFTKKDGTVFLKEFERNRFRETLQGDFYSALEIPPRQYIPISGSDSYKCICHFEASEDEKLFGMGQYQYPNLNLKGCKLELAQRNSQITIPFYISSRMYGFLWNNPAIGRVAFAENITEWEADVTKQIDYWVTTGDNPSEIEKHYTELVGRAPEIPDFALGFWQCKLRYSTQEELLSIARKYYEKKIPVSVIVADFFHWPHEGDWKFDSRYWPDPKAMVKELESMGMRLMVSVWPTVEEDSENYQDLSENGYLVQTVNGKNTHILGTAGLIDVTSPGCRDYVWGKLKENYYDDGINIFWLDEAEPELTGYEFDRYRYYLGSDKQIGNVYPREYARMAYEGMNTTGQNEIINLIRCAWIGSQRYGTLVWSGDIDSSYTSLKNQIVAGQNIGLAGIPWWNTDIGGFGGGNIYDPSFIELLIRWFQFGAFSPVMRLHGYRQPFLDPIGKDGGGKVGSGSPNEIWSYGPDAERVFAQYIKLRYLIRDYLKKTMHEAHCNGSPAMRPLFYNFPDDLHTWDIKFSYMLGDDILVAPVIEPNTTSMTVYLPHGTDWCYLWDDNTYSGGQTIDVETPISRIPIFIRESNTELVDTLREFAINSTL
jgi:alpha-D-xyloside xylohydrolase